MQLKSKNTYVLNEKKLNLHTKEDVVAWIRKNGKKLNEKDIDSNTVIGMFTDHRAFWVVSFARGKAGYKRLKKQLKEMLDSDKKAHTKTKRMRGQLFVLTDPDNYLDYFLETRT